MFAQGYLQGMYTLKKFEVMEDNEHKTQTTLLETANKIISNQKIIIENEEKIIEQNSNILLKLS